MATKENVLVKIGELLEHHRALCIDHAEKLMASGAIDWQDYADDYRLPKIILTACLMGHARDFHPLRDEDIATVSNLRNF